MKKELLASICLLGLAASQVANAASITVSANVGALPSRSDINRLDFDLFDLGGDTQSTGPIGDGVAVSFSPDGQVVAGSVLGKYAAPWITTLQDNLFSGENYGEDGGPDKTKYLTSGIETGSTAPGAFHGSVTLTFANPQKYLGLLWGSVDTYNTLSFYDGSTFLGSITGNQLLASPKGDQGPDGTVYANINSDTAFTKVIATSSQYAFEFDNVAYAQRNVPDGGSTLALLGGVITFLGAVRRKFQK